MSCTCRVPTPPCFQPRPPLVEVRGAEALVLRCELASLEGRAQLGDDVLEAERLEHFGGVAMARWREAAHDAGALGMSPEAAGGVLTSGGSTGEPGVFCWSLAEMARFGASAFRWSAANGEGPPARAALAR